MYTMALSFLKIVLKELLVEVLKLWLCSQTSLMADSTNVYMNLPKSSCFKQCLADSTNAWLA